jgi:hypothetical protein
MTSQLATLSVAITLLLSPECFATNSLPAISFTGEHPNDTSANSTRGFEFNVTNTEGVLVTHLAVYDRDADGLIESHAVGIWNAAGLLLGSASVPSGTAAPLDANHLFRIVEVPQIFLAQGDGYVVGAQFAVGSADVQARDWSTLDAAPGITYVGARFINDVVPLSFPTFSLGSGLPGGSFQVQTVPCPPLSIRVSNLAEVELCWPTSTGRVYRLEYRSEITTNAWISLYGTNIPGTGSPACFREPATQPLRFYRLVCVTN